MTNTMLLSDAIATGRTLVANCAAGGSTRYKAKPGDGCVLDMAALAVGKENWEDARKVWPWLLNVNPVTFRNYEEEIYQLFDFAVMSGGMTLDQLIDYVRSVEPAPEPTFRSGLEELNAALSHLGDTIPATQPAEERAREARALRG